MDQGKRIVNLKQEHLIQLRNQLVGGCFVRAK
jgi:hypothetical protein